MNTKQKIIAGTLAAFLTLGGGGLLKNTFAGEAKTPDVKVGVDDKTTVRTEKKENVVKPVSTQQVNVPFKDARVNSVKAVKAYAAHVSNDGLLLVILGKDQNLFNEANQAAKEAIGEGRPLRGIVVGPMDQPASVILYADAMDVSYDAVMKSKENILNAIREADEKILKSPAVAKAEPVLASN